MAAANPTDKELLRAYHDEGDLAAREQLIERYMSLVRSLAREDDELGLRRVLETVCDKVEVARRGGDSWVELTKLTREAA